MNFDLDDDTFHGLAGGDQAPDPSPPILTGGSLRVGKAIISIIAGCLFLLTALAGLIISLNCLWGGVFNNTPPMNAVVGFLGGVVVALLAGLFGWRFISKA